MYRMVALFGLLVVMTSASSFAALPQGERETTVLVNRGSLDGAVRDWMILGAMPNPIMDPKPKTGPFRVGYDKDYLTSLGGEGKAKLSPTTTVTYSDEKGRPQLAKVHRLSIDTEGCLDFERVFAGADYKVAYAFSQIESDRDEVAYFHFGSDDSAKVWINGKLVHAIWTPGRTATPLNDAFEAHLRKGLNDVLVKVEDRSGEWKFILVRGTKIVDEEAYVDAWRHMGGLEERGGRLWPPIPDTDSGWMLFVDKGILNDALPRMHNITETLHQPVKYEGNPIFVPKPGEGAECGPGGYPHAFAAYGDTMYDEEEQIFKMWYVGVSNRLPLPCWTVRYATSKDGIHWDRPNLGMFEHKGSKDNNICLESLNKNVRLKGRTKTVTQMVHFFSGVIKDMDEPDPAKRYKSINLQAGIFDPETGNVVKEHTPAAIGTCTSPDGIHWTMNKEQTFVDEAFEFGIGDVMTLWHNRKRKKYVALIKGHAYDPGVTGDQGGIRRLQSISESGDFKNWTTPVVAVAPDDQDPDDMHVYGMMAFDYENMYLGLIMAYRANDDRKTIDVQLVSSRNGRRWRRAGDRETFIPLGELGSWDSGEIFPLRQPVAVGDELWFYYSAASGRRPHAPLLPGDPQRSHGALGLAKLPKGRFVSMDAGEEEGWLLTMPMKLKGNTLHLNANAAKGDILVEIRESVFHKADTREPQWDKQLGAPIPGFSRYDCNVMTTNGLDHVVTWRGKSDLSEIGDKEVMLKIIMRNAELYGFKID